MRFQIIVVEVNKLRLEICHLYMLKQRWLLVLRKKTTTAMAVQVVEATAACAIADG